MKVKRNNRPAIWSMRQRKMLIDMLSRIFGFKGILRRFTQSSGPKFFEELRRHKSIISLNIQFFAKILLLRWFKIDVICMKICYGIRCLNARSCNPKQKPFYLPSQSGKTGWDMQKLGLKAKKKREHWPSSRKKMRNSYNYHFHHYLTWKYHNYKTSLYHGYTEPNYR